MVSDDLNRRHIILLKNKIQNNCLADMEYSCTLRVVWVLNLLHIIIMEMSFGTDISPTKTNARDGGVVDLDLQLNSNLSLHC